MANIYKKGYRYTKKNIFDYKIGIYTYRTKTVLIVSFFHQSSDSEMLT